MRALVTIFTVLLICISVYKLSFTFFVNKHEKELETKSAAYIKRNFPTPEARFPADKTSQAIYADSLSSVKGAYMDSLVKATKEKSITWWGDSYQKAKESELLLGLDLQGGINVTMDIALDGLIKGIANNPKDPKLLAAIAEAQRQKLSSDKNFIDLFASAYQSANPGVKLASLFATGNRREITSNSGDGAVISFIKGEANNSMKQTYQVLRKRIDKFGVAQPNINLDENKGIINVELAGATDPERVKKYLQSTANLQFWELYTFQEQDIVSAMQNADAALEKYLGGNKLSASDSALLKQADSLRTLKDSFSIARADSLKRRVDSNALATRSNPLFRILYPIQPQSDNGVTYYPAAVAQSLIKDTAKVNEYLNLPIVRNNFPANVKFLWGKQNRDDKGNLIEALQFYIIKTRPGRDGAELEGNGVESADQSYDELGKITVSMTMTSAGARTWADMTGRNVSKPIAIVLDDIVYSAPNVTQKIEGGNSQITMGGGGTSKNNQLVLAEAQDLANILKAGKLEAPAKIVQLQEVGPTLGTESVNGGIKSFLIAFGVIFALMLVYYNTAGMVANIALILNLLFTIGVLSALGATLTAAGIAGLVLTIGMAVDTNVIIFERIKEELAKGLSHNEAVKIGYRRSLPPVLDAHVTSFLTAAILAYFGLGPVLGFATTQMLGILLSLFCGILVSRLITDIFTSKNRHFNYFTALSKRIFKHASFKFIEYRRVAYGISLVVLALGIAAIFNGFNQGVEFSGGRSYIVNFHKPVNEEEVRLVLEKAFNKTPVIKTYGSASRLDITTDYKIEEQGLGVDSTVKKALYAGLKPFLGDVSYERFSSTEFVEGSKKVDPTISDDLKKGAQWATFWAMLIIAIYIFIRFRDWRYSLGTIVALLHDVLVTLAVFSFLKNVVPFPLEIDQHFIAAILTVIGFSMNDTVIVFDRIREYSRTMKGAEKGVIINKAINDTLSRTIMTSLTVFITILILFLVGGEVTKGFAFAMLIGVAVGTYSSIFVAAPILMDFAKSKPLGEADILPHHETGVKKKQPVPLAKKA